MNEHAIDDLTALLPPLLESLDALAFLARHLEPQRFGEVLDSVGTPDATLRQVRENLHDWPAHLAGLRARMESASDATLAAFGGFRAAPDAPDGLRAAFRALKHPPRALDALYPLARALPPVSRFFLEPASRENAGIEARLADTPEIDDVGVMHMAKSAGGRGVSIYVPEYYTPDRAWPLVVALHGGSGDGFSFLWSWLPAARAHGAILIAPSSLGRSWALNGDDIDTPHLANLLAKARARWRIDPTRLLLTGMSDGGTFCYVSGLEASSPFTHLAPVSASFHPLLAEMAAPERIAGLPIRLTHGAGDWMFPVAIAREAHRALSAAGARVTYREIDDLSHCFPREECAEILRWLDGASGVEA
jgi:phospholipase/carboxylesterase